MRFLLVVFASLMMASVVAADSETVDWFSKDQDSVMVRAYFSDEQMLQDLASNKAPWFVDNKKSYALVEINEFEYVELIADGFELELDEQRTAELHAVHVRSPNQRAGIDGFACYRTVTETYADAQQLTTDYPGLVEWVDIGDSWEKTNGQTGHDLRVLKITNSAITGPKPKLFVMSAIHAREYTTAETNTRFGEYLLDNYATDADARWLVDHHEVHLSLISNPDGRVEAQGGALWRKNTNESYCSPTSSNRGADLNRNFDFQWGCCGGSSTSACSEVYRGPAPGSEPEVAAIQNYLRTIFDDQRGPGQNDAAPADAQGVFIDVHSFSQFVLWPWGYTGANAGNNTALQTLGRKFSFFNNYRPEKASVSFNTDGTTDDFAYGDLGVAAYTFELGTSFFQDCGSFESTIFPDNLQALIYAAKAAGAPYLRPAGPDITDIVMDNAAVIAGTQINMTATANDARYNNTNGAEPVQNISGGSYYLDVAPWEAGAVAIPMAATDGGFDSAEESLSAVIDTTGLSIGEHIVYLDAQDNGGNTGVVSSRFIYVIDQATSPVIAGVVTRADTGLGLEAVISAGSFQTVSDASTGSYSMFVIEGDYTLTVEPVDTSYGGTSLSDVNAINSQSTDANFSLFPFCNVFEDDAETTVPGWITSGNWARTQETANSPVTSWTDSPGGNYSNNQNVSLTSPVIDLSASTSAELNFAQICNTEATYDFCIVEISTDGTNWSEVARYDETSGNTWNDRTLDVSGFAGSANARLRFRLSTDVSVLDDGWHVDDIGVSAAGPQCVTAVDTDNDGIFDASDNCTLVANADQLDVDGDNYGNICDADFNNDGVTNFFDLNIFINDFLSVGALVTDINGDGATNFFDLTLFIDKFLQTPGPSGLVAP